jgi:hypothetical protein
MDRSGVFQRSHARRTDGGEARRAVYAAEVMGVSKTVFLAPNLKNSLTRFGVSGQKKAGSRALPPCVRAVWRTAAEA